MLADHHHPAMAYVGPLWEPFAEYLVSVTPLPQTDQAADDEARLRELGRVGFLEMWRRLGLHPRPQPPTFYLGVTEPDPRPR